MNGSRQVRLPLPSRSCTRHAWTAFLVGFLLVGCGGAPEDLCRVAPPPDPEAYVSEMQDSRRSRETWFRSSEDSPVPAELRHREWEGLQYFEVDPRMRFTGPLVQQTAGRRFEIATTSGELRPCAEVGYFLLDLGAGPEKLPVYELLDQSESQRNLFLPFMDATTTVETYPAGRYLEAEPLGRGQFLLDFNRAYNPSCAYGGSFQCPVTPPQNRLKAAVRAGERGWHHAEASR